MYRKENGCPSLFLLRTMFRETNAISFLMKKKEEEKRFLIKLNFPDLFLQRKTKNEDERFFF